VKSQHILLCTGLLTLVAALPLRAQSARNTAEAVADQRQIQAERAALERDREEAERFAALIESLESARHERDLERYLQVNTALRGMMAREADQARRKAARAQAEVGQSRREARAEVMEAHASGLPRDGLQVLDDHRDLRDDRRDRAAISTRASEMGALISRAETLLPRVEDADLEAFSDNGVVMRRFLEIVRADLTATQRELGEDLSERREDRRERHSDRRK
jgi:hypothetical protein